MSRPVLLDLFCGAGGAARGYEDAGFTVVGVDIKPMPRYPYPFIQDDALAFLDWMLAGNSNKSFDAIHASPPCQAYSVTARLRPDLAGKHPRLIEPTRERLIATGLPYVIENVPTAPLIDPVWLCGCQFGRVTYWPGKGYVALRRKRGFESNFPIPDAGPHEHKYLCVPVFGGGPSGKRNKLNGPGRAQAAREVMGIDWMTTDELALPPAYTEHVGRALVRSIPVFGHGRPGNRPDLDGPGYAKAACEVMGVDWMTRSELTESIPPAFTEYVGSHLLSHLAADRPAA